MKQTLTTLTTITAIALLLWLAASIGMRGYADRQIAKEAKQALVGLESRVLGLQKVAKLDWKSGPSASGTDHASLVVNLGSIGIAFAVPARCDFVDPIAFQNDMPPYLMLKTEGWSGTLLPWVAQHESSQFDKNYGYSRFTKSHRPVRDSVDLLKSKIITDRPFLFQKLSAIMSSGDLQDYFRPMDPEDVVAHAEVFSRYISQWDAILFAENQGKSLSSYFFIGYKDNLLTIRVILYNEDYGLYSTVELQAHDQILGEEFMIFDSQAPDDYIVCQ